MRTIQLPAIAKTGAKDSYFVTDLPGLAIAAREHSTGPEASSCNQRMPHWTGTRFDYLESCQALISGDLAGVAESDALLEKIESSMPHAYSSAWQTFDVMAGGVPNVPAFLSGNPVNMRQRRRTMSEQAPLAVFADTTLSASITAADMRKRGAAILALVRLLSNCRPVELWAVVGAGNEDSCAYVMARIETSPLDVARAAHALTEPSVTRGIGYALIRAIHTSTAGFSNWSGGWAYGSDSTYRKHAQASMQRVAATGSDAMYLAAAHANDPAVNNPVEWLGHMLRQYGGQAFNIDAA